MKNFKKMVGLAALAASMVWTGIAQAAYTKEDVEAAKKNPVELKKIVDDTATDNRVRTIALRALPVTKDLLPYLGKEWIPIGQRFWVAYGLEREGILPTKDYPAEIAAGVAAGNYNVVLMQRDYVKALLKSGDTAKALSESKRLLGINWLDQKNALRTVNTIAGAIKGDALINGKSATQAIAAMNAYLEGINNKDVSALPFTALPFPDLDPKIVALESSDNTSVAVLALLYNGKYESAQTKGNELLIVATSAGQVKYALYVIGAAKNGAAGLPTAANADEQAK